MKKQVCVQKPDPYPPKVKADEEYEVIYPLPYDAYIVMRTRKYRHVLVKKSSLDSAPKVYINFKERMLELMWSKREIYYDRKGNDAVCMEGDNSSYPDVDLDKMFTFVANTQWTWDPVQYEHDKNNMRDKADIMHTQLIKPMFMGDAHRVFFGQIAIIDDRVKNIQYRKCPNALPPGKA